MRIDVRFHDAGAPLCVNVNSGSSKFDMGFGSITVIDGMGKSGLPRGGEPGDIILKKSDEDYDAEWVTPASAAEHKNRLPITSEAVYEEISKIDMSLATTTQVNRLF